ncbi:hypothetical protein C7B81_13320 [Aphanothece cf. minutissima CCALA 015]|uniref:Uncharacterized protein n=1 Tax=Aphanothece cf. minutissima CCALA 015 TaxID=2107695 RepID=A0ABX5F576_9CHRO|nr:hypothetical protein C7B81_13320 [Aphanothece cf. minutissima CCALA 015]
MSDDRTTRLAELQQQLDALSEEGRATEPNTPEREAVLERWAPVFAAVVALKEELGRCGES